MCLQRRNGLHNQSSAHVDTGEGGGWISPYMLSRRAQDLDPICNVAHRNKELLYTLACYPSVASISRLDTRNVNERRSQRGFVTILN